MQLLDESATVMTPRVRKTIVQVRNVVVVVVAAGV